jgi:hypothetical protein
MESEQLRTYVVSGETHGIAWFSPSVTAPIVLDTGATRSILPTSVLQKLMDAPPAEMQYRPLVEPLPTPRVLLTADGKSSFTARHRCSLSFDLQPDRHEPVAVGPLEFYIADGPTEVIISEHAMESIGYPSLYESSRAVVAARLAAGHRPRFAQRSPPLAPSSQLDRSSASSPPGNHRLVDVIRRVVVEQRPPPGPVSPSDEILPAASVSASPTPSGNTPSSPAIVHLFHAAAADGMAPSQLARLRAEFHNDPRLASVFVDSIIGLPAMKVAPARLILRDPEHVHPVHASTPRLSENEAQFVRIAVHSLEQAQMLIRCTDSPHSTAINVVKRSSATDDTPLAEQYRITGNYVAINELTVPVDAPAYLPDVMISQMAGARFFASVDVKDAYWTVPLHPDSQRLASIKVPGGVFRPTRVTQGLTDAPAFFTNAMHQAFGDLIGPEHGLAPFVDDILLWARTQEELVDRLLVFLRRCVEVNLWLNVKKARLFATRVRWCGRVISADGVSHDPERLQGLRALPVPRRADELLQFVHAVSWMRESLPQFSRLIAPLNVVLERAMTLAKSRRKRRVARIALQAIGWSSSDSAAFRRVQEALLTIATLAFPDPNKVACVFTDASSTGYGGVVTQIPVEDVDKPLQDQRHEPLAFLSGVWKGAQLNYSTLDQEALAIVTVVSKMDYLLRGRHPFRLATDHANLVYLLRGSSASNRQTASRLARWRALLDDFRFVITHVPGVDMHWPDALSRWAASASLPTTSSVEDESSSVEPAPVPWSTFVQRVHQQFGGATVDRTASTDQPPDPPAELSETSSRLWMPSPSSPAPVRALRADGVQVPLSRLADPELPAALLDMSASDLPDLDIIAAAQQAFVANGGIVPSTVTRDTHGLYRTVAHNQLYVPPDPQLVLRIFVGAHAGASGHRAAAATESALRPLVWWPSMSDDIRAHVRACLHCSPARGAHLVPRPQGHLEHATAPNQIIHLDYVHVHSPPSQHWHRYEGVLVVRCDFSAWTEFIPVQQYTAEATASALYGAWFKRFGVPPIWHSDGGSHFMSSVVQQLCAITRSRHTVSTPYHPRGNGVAERAGAELLFALRALCSEFRLPFRDWPKVLDLAQSSINATPAARLDGLTPTHVFLGHPPQRVIDFILAPNGAPSTVTVPASTVSAITKRLEKTLSEYHDRVASYAATHSRSRPPSHPRAVPARFQVGDWVLVARVNDHRRSKLALKWIGPRQVVGYCHDSQHLVFVVKDIISGAVDNVHASRLRFFSSKDLNITTLLKDYVAAQGGANDEFTVESVIAHRYVNGALEFKVKWLGFQIEEATFEPVHHVWPSATAAVQRYIRALPASATRNELFQEFCRQ